ncbi:MAG: RidA family protein [Alphaproteobacteria bacterium]
MQKTIIQTEQSPAAIGPYSQAVKLGDMLYCSGQIPLNPKSMKVEAETIEEQTHQVLKNLMAVLAAAGSSADMVVKTTCYLSDMANFAQFNEVYSEYLGNSKPARATIEVAALPLGVLVEVDAIATCSSDFSY